MPKNGQGPFQILKVECGQIETPLEGKAGGLAWGAKSVRQVVSFSSVRGSSTVSTRLGSHSPVGLPAALTTCVT